LRASSIDLEARLQEADKAGARLKLIATDGVFSMDGKIAPLDKICDIAEKYNALIFVDDCHSTGFLGPNGRGTAEYYGVQDRVHIVNSTLGKALGGAAGGYTTGCKEMIDLLRNRSRPYLFSNSLPPAVVGSASAALDLIEGAKTNGLFDQLWGNTKLFRKLLGDAGFTIKVLNMIISNRHSMIPTTSANNLLQHLRPGLIRYTSILG
jgi:glycine C-acetyltransferase